MTTPDPTPEMTACSDAVTKAITPLLMEYDSRLLFACLGAEVAYIGALLRESGVYKPETVTRVISEMLVTAITLNVKAPKVLYSDGGEKLGTKQ